MDKTVLIVEDDPSFAEFLAVTVRAAGHRARVAHDGETALRLAQEEWPDLVFLDLLVPKQDGHAVCARLRSMEGGDRLPIVMVTGIYKKLEYREAARRELGITDYLTKPVRMVDLWDLMGKYLGGADVPQPEPGASEGDATAVRDLFEGTPVAEKPLAVLLGELYRERRTGLVFLKGGGRLLILFLDGGELVFARSNDPESRLGARLVRHGILEPEDLQAAEEFLAKSGDEHRMGEVLVSMGLLGRPQLEEIVKEHLESLVREAFREEAWRAAFVEGELPSDEEICIGTPTPGLILEGVREMPAAESLRAHLPGPGSILGLSETGRDRVREMGLTPYEEKMLALCDGNRPLRKVLAIGRLAPVEIDRLLFGLLQVGVLTVDKADAGRISASLVEDVSGGPDPRADAEERQGELGERLLPEVILDLHREEASGVLNLRRGEDQAWLYFEQGTLVFAGSNEEQSRIGEILIESHLVSEEQVKKAAEALQQSDSTQRLGQRLVEEGLISLEELSWAITLQMQRRVQALLPWTSGSWTFRPGACPTDEAITLGFNTVDVVLEGIRRLDPSLAQSRLGGNGWVVQPGVDPLVRTERLTREEQKMLSCVRPGRPVADILEASVLEEDQARRSLYALVVLGAVTLEREKSMDEEADAALGFLGSEPPAARPPAPPQASPNPQAGNPASNGAGEMVPRPLLEKAMERQEATRKEMFDLYQQFDQLKGVVASLRDEIQTLKTSPLYSRMEPGIRDTVGSILEEYLQRLETTVH